MDIQVSHTDDALISHDSSCLDGWFCILVGDGTLYGLRSHCSLRIQEFV
jgi:hypothetical protein